MDNTPKANEQIADYVEQEIKEEFEDGEMMLDIKEEEEEGDINEVDLDDDNEGDEADDYHRMSMNSPNGHNAADIDILFARWMRDDEIELSEPERSNLELITEQNRDISNASTSSNGQSNLNLANLVDQEEGQVNNNNIQRQFDETNNTVEMIEEEDGDGETQVDDIEAAKQGTDGESRRMENLQMDTTPTLLTEQSRANTNTSVRRAKRKHEEPQVRNEVTNGDNLDVEDENEDDAGEGTSRKRPRPSRPITSSTEPKQIVTINLRCPQGCPEMLTKDEFNLHMWEKHSILRYRCVVKDCKQSFDKKNNMNEHLAQSHQSTIQWHCDKCDHHFSTYQLLTTHNYEYHQLGHFQCSFLACTFTGEYKRKVYDHYNYRHKQTFSCYQPGCSYQTSTTGNLKRHQRESQPSQRETISMQMAPM